MHRNQESQSSNFYKEIFFDQLVDKDIYNNAELYVTWATLVSVVISPGLVNETRDMLVSLEARLQIVWNRCFMISNFADDIFNKKSKVYDVTKFYWSFVNSLDDAKGVLSSTLSSRAGVAFDEMLKTSRVAGEIDRLKDKVDLLEKYLHQQREKTSLKYQRTIEALLFLTALSQLIPLFLKCQCSRINWLAKSSLDCCFCLALLLLCADNYPLDRGQRRGREKDELGSATYPCPKS